MKRSHSPRRKVSNESLPSIDASSHMDMLRKLAQIISSNFGVQVIFRGTEAWTDGKIIVVPSLSESAPKDLIEAVIGFVDHEVGHVLFTDMKFDKPFTDPDPRVRGMTNAVEDVRQEYLMGLEYKGAGFNMDRTHEWALKRLQGQWNDPRMDSLYKFSVLLIAHAKTMQGVPCFTAFYEDNKRGFEPMLAAVEHETRNFINLKNVEESYEAAKRILAILDDMQSESETQKQKDAASQQNQQMQQNAAEAGARGEQSDDSDSQQGQSGEGSDGKQGGEQQSKGQGDQGDGDDEGKGAGGSDGDEQGDDDAEAGAGGSGNDEDDDEGDGQGKGSGNGDGDDEGEGSGAGDDEGDGDEGDGGSDGQQSTTRNDQKPDPSQMSKEERRNLEGLGRGACSGSYANNDGPLHKFIAEQLAIDGGQCTGHRPYSTECDVVAPPVGEAKLEDYNRILDEVKPTIHVVSKVLTRTLLAQTRAQTLRGRHSGRVSMNSVSQLRAKQTGIFETVREGRKIDTFVQLIVDQSGSMHGGKIRTASKTAIALAEALDKVGVKFAISGFTAGFGFPGGKAYQKQAEALHRKIWNTDEAADYERTDPIIEYVYKAPEQRLAQSRPQLALMTKQWMGCNADGDSVFKIAKRVAHRKEARKVVIVISDGLPAASQGHRVPGDAAERYMRHVAESIDKGRGMEIIGIGINSNAVKHYYRRHFVLDSIDKLPSLALTELKDALLDKRRAAA